MKLKGTSAGVAVRSFQKQALASVSHEGEGEKELLSQNSCWWVSSREGWQVPCWLLPYLIF